MFSPLFVYSFIAAAALTSPASGKYTTLQTGNKSPLLPSLPCTLYLKGLCVETGDGPASQVLPVNQDKKAGGHEKVDDRQQTADKKV